MRTINQIIVHCADTYIHMDIGVKEIRKWHVEERGWSDIGYHHVICRDGILEPGRPVERAGAHCKGHNEHSIGICLVGGKGDDDKPECNFTSEQWRSLQLLVDDLLQTYDAKVQGHNELDTHKTCPNFNVQAWAKGFD